MAVEEAALQMDLLGHDFYLFTNAESGRAAVLYRRRDGHLGLIEAVGLAPHRASVADPARGRR